MKVKENFTCKKVLDDYMVIPTGERMTDYLGTIILSESAASAWKYLEKGCTREELINAILSEYQVDTSVVEADVDALIAKLQEYEVLEERTMGE